MKNLLQNLWNTMTVFWSRIKQDILTIAILIGSVVLMNAGYGEGATIVRVMFLWAAVIVMSTLTVYLYTKKEFKESEIVLIYLANSILVGLAIVGMYFVQK